MIKKWTKKTLMFLSLFLLLAYPNGNYAQEYDYSIVVISDVHISNDESKDNRLLELTEKINSGEIPDVKFVAVTGDFVSAVFTAGKERSDENSRLVKGISIMNNLNVPYYIAMGNHDYKIDNDRDSDTYFPESEILEMEKLWKEITEFDRYFVIEGNGWNFIFLNSMRGRYLNRFFDDEQLNWLKNLLAQNKPALLFFHHPIQTDNTPEVYLNKLKEKDLITPEKEPRFFEIVKQHKENIKGIFLGHLHIWSKDMLFGAIPTVLTNSFADQSGLPFHLIKVDSDNDVINVERVHLNKD